MDKTTTALETPLREQLDRLAAFEPTEFPVLSLYLDMRTDQEGRRTHRDAYLRKVLPERTQAFTGEARKSVERDVERIHSQIAGEARSSAAAFAIFACSAAGDFFEAIQLDAPIEGHQLFIQSTPHLYPLARVNDQYPRYAALVMDTNSARLFVFGLGTRETRSRISNLKTRRHSMGGWAQARYQRHTENFHLHHTKEVVAALDRIVRTEHINQIVVSCEDAARPVLMEQLPRHLADKIIDIRLSAKTPDHQIMSDTLDAIRNKDAVTDAEHVEAMLGAWRGNGLAVVGPEATLDALIKGQVEELLITARPDLLKSAESERDQMAGALVTKAQQNAARIRFIEDPDLMNEVGGVGALLRFKI
jgi:peptide subunit release factor 1 (eRF1)